MMLGKYEYSGPAPNHETEDGVAQQFINTRLLIGRLGITLVTKRETEDGVVDSKVHCSKVRSRL